MPQWFQIFFGKADLAGWAAIKEKATGEYSFREVRAMS